MSHLPCPSMQEARIRTKANNLLKGRKPLLTKVS